MIDRSLYVRLRGRSLFYCYWNRRSGDLEVECGIMSVTGTPTSISFDNKLLKLLTWVGFKQGAEDGQKLNFGCPVGSCLRLHGLGAVGH